MKLSGKIMAFVVAIIIVAVLSVTFMVMMETTGNQDDFNEQRVVSSAGALKNEIDSMSEKVQYCAELLAQNRRIISAMDNANTKGLQLILDDLNESLKLDTISVTDEQGTVLLRQHQPDKMGDNIKDQSVVQNALTQKKSWSLESGELVGLSTRAGARVEKETGAIIGVIVVGYKFENASFLEALKKEYGMEFTIFSGSTRLATTLTQENSDALNTEMDPTVKAAVLDNGQTYTGKTTIFGKPYIASYMPLIDKDGNIVGALASAMSQEDANAAIMQTVLHAALTALAVIIISAFVISLFVRRSIRKPMLAMVDASRALADGNMDVKIDVNNRKDEIGILGKAFVQVIEKISSLIKDSAALEGRIAEGNLLERADESAYSGEYKTLIQGYNKTVDTLVEYIDKLPLPVLVMDREFTMHYINENGAALLESTQEELLGRKCHDLFRTDDCLNGQCVCLRAMNSGEQKEGETTARLENGTTLEIRYMGMPIFKDGEVVGVLEAITDLTEIQKAHRESEQRMQALKVLLEKIDDAAVLVESGSRQVSEGSQVLSQGATEQAAAIQELSSSITEIAQQTKINARNSEKASAVADATRGGTAVIDEKMQEMLQAMNDISASSSNISKIIKTIDDIAFQTNILALNAAVEAARAGVHGKGFAVVAEEVRNLASRSAVAAKDTTQMIETSLSTVAEGTKVAADTAKTLEAVVKGIAESAALMDEVAAASKQQSLGISQVEKGIEQVALVIQNITATAEESAAASEELSGQAVVLTELVHEHNTDSLQNADIKSLGDGTEKREQIPITNDEDFGKY